MASHQPLVRQSAPGRARLLRALCVLVATVVAAVGAPAGATAQAVYGSLSGTVTDSSGGALPGVTITIKSLERNVVDVVVANESGNYTKDRLLPGTYEVKAELSGFKAAVVPRVTVSVDTQTPGQLQARSRCDDRGGDRHGWIAAAQDGPGGCVHDVRLAADDRVAGARSQSDEVRPADPRHAAIGLAACREREPAGVDADHGQRPALQRHGLSARWHREPRSHPRDHRDQLDARVSGRDENHVAELRRGVRAGDGRCRVGADQVWQQRAARQRVRVLSRGSVPGPEPVHAVPAGSAHRTLHSRDLPSPVRCVARGADPCRPLLLLRRLPGHARQARRLPALDRADRGRAARRPQRLRREHLRSGDGGDSRQPHAILREPDSAGSAVGPGARHPPADSDAECDGP